MQHDSLISAVHDRRQFLQLALGTGLVAATGSPGHGQQPDPEPDTPAEQIKLADEVRKFLEESLDVKARLTREAVAESWRRAKILYRKFVELETEFFDVIYTYRDKDLESDQRSGTLAPVDLDYQEFEKEEKRLLEELNAERPDEDSLAKLLVAKIMSVLGVEDVSGLAALVLDLLKGDELIQPLEMAVKEKNWPKAAKALGRVIQGMLKPSFVKRITEKLGARAAGLLAGRIGARFVPVIGWLILAGSLIQAIREQTADK